MQNVPDLVKVTADFLKMSRVLNAHQPRFISTLLHFCHLSFTSSVGFWYNERV